LGCKSLHAHNIQRMRNSCASYTLRGALLRTTNGLIRETGGMTLATCPFHTVHIPNKRERSQRFHPHTPCILPPLDDNRYSATLRPSSFERPYYVLPPLS
jgi:hypothetical protein